MNCLGLALCVCCSLPSPDAVGDSYMPQLTAEVRALGTKVERLEDKVDAMRETLAALSATITQNQKQVDEDHVTLTHPIDGVVVTQRKIQGSLARHSWVMYTTAGGLSTLLFGIAGAAIRRRLWGNGNGD